jgi:hypothetical protein
VNAIERLVPVPPMSDEAFRVFSRIRYCGNPARGLWAAVGADEIAPDDLPPIIADLWTYNDSPTADLHEEAWAEVFRAAGFFSYPPLVRTGDGPPVPLERPGRAMTLYRGVPRTGCAVCHGHATLTWRGCSEQDTPDLMLRYCIRQRSCPTISWPTWNGGVKAGLLWLTQPG